MDIDVFKHLEKVRPFLGCSEKFLGEVTRKIKVVRLSSGTNVITYGDSSSDVYINFSGLLEVTYLLREGRKVTFDLISPYRFFGEISTIDGKDRSASIDTISDVSLGVIDNKFFRDFMLSNLDFVRGLLNDAATTIRNNNQQIVHLASADSKKKVIMQLLRLSKIDPTGVGSTKVVEGVSHEAIASFVGLSRESVSRMISILKREGLILETRKGHISLDMEKISRFIQLKEDELINW